jgi:hypothetical protein
VALSLLKQFSDNFAEIHAQCILADALYGNKKFMEQVSSCFGGVQVINQLIRIKGWEKSIATYFKNNPGVKRPLIIRGGETLYAIMDVGKLWIKAHGKKR